MADLLVVALDIDFRGRSTWFGFSPAVILAVGLVAVGGGAMAVASGGSYEASIKELCVDSGKQVEAHAKAWSADRMKPGGDREANIFTDIAGAVGLRLAGLEKIEPDADHAGLHQRLVASEKNVAQLTAQGLATFQTQGYGSVTSDVQTILAAMHESDVLFAEAGAPKGCAD